MVLVSMRRSAPFVTMCKRCVTCLGETTECGCNGELIAAVAVTFKRSHNTTSVEKHRILRHPTLVLLLHILSQALHASANASIVCKGAAGTRKRVFSVQGRLPEWEAQRLSRLMEFSFFLFFRAATWSIRAFECMKLLLVL